uniref:ubiquitin/ISG15-conjugating enzyme E2 L6 n=1 Tax=Panthera onca TaxID=9690 RepID=UPI0029555EE0
LGCNVIILRNQPPWGPPWSEHGGAKGSGRGLPSPPSQDFSLRPDVLTWLLSPVLEALNVLVNRPDLGQPVRLELADLLKQDPELFHREAREFTLKYGVDRPS